MGSNSACIFPNDIIGIFCQYMPNSTLKQCCLTSRTFRYFSRPLLFRRITIRNGPDEEHPRAAAFKFWESLTLDPKVGVLVKSLTLLHTGMRGSKHWFTSLDVQPKLSYIMTHLPNLINFSIERCSPPPWGDESSWEFTLMSGLTSAIQHVLNLPSLKSFHFYERFELGAPTVLHQLLRLTRPSSIRSLHLCGCKLIERDGSSSSLELAAYKAKIENLRLYCAGQDPDDGLAWILSLTSPISSFNLANLSSLELWALCVHDESWIAAILDAQMSDFILQHLGLFGVEGYPTKGLLKQSLSRFTSVCKLSISEATMPIFRRNFMEVKGITFGYAAAWISILPANITSTVEELYIHIEASCWLHGPLGVDEILSYNSLNAMSKVKQVKLHLEETSEEFDADVFLREEWYNNCEDTELYHEPDQVKLREWVASVVLPKTYLEGKVSIEV